MAKVTPRRFGFIILMMCTVIGAYKQNISAAYPLSTDDAGIVSLNGYELEAGYEDCKDENELINRSCGISFKYGASEKMDIGISFPCQIDPVTDEKMGAATLGLKFSFVKDVLAVSFSNELGEKDYFMNAAYTKEFAIAVFNLNVGYLSTGDTTTRGSGSYGVSMEFPLKKLEIAGELQGQEGGAGNGLLGVRYWINDGFFAAVGISKAFNTAENRVTGGFHVEF